MGSERTHVGTAGLMSDGWSAAGLAPTVSSLSKMVFSVEMILRVAIFVWGEAAKMGGEDGFSAQEQLVRMLRRVSPGILREFWQQLLSLGLQVITACTVQ